MTGVLYSENVTRWTQHETDNSLKDRVSDIQSWRLSLTKTLQDTEDEIAAVSYCAVTAKQTCSYCQFSAHYDVVTGLLAICRILSITVHDQKFLTRIRPKFFLGPE